MQYFNHMKNSTNMKHILFTVLAVLVVLSAQGQTTPKPFIMKWETTAANEEIIIPTDAASGTYSYMVNWGDGSSTSTAQTGDAAHTYTMAGTYTVTISGTFPAIRFATTDELGIRVIPTPAAGQIRTVEQWGDQVWASMELAFAGCTNLTIASGAGAPDLSDVTNMERMFAGYEEPAVFDEEGNLLSPPTNVRTTITGDISAWNVENITNMDSLCKIF